MPSIGSAARAFMLSSLLVVSIPAAAAATTTEAVAPVGTSPCPKVRPGAHVQTSQDTGGSLNFLFEGSDGHRYVGTAGHLLANEATHVWRKDGPTATIDDGTTIGRAVFAWNYNALPRDFALIRLGRGVKADPSMCHWGGPTALNDDMSTQPTDLRPYGQGMGISEVVPARTLVAPSLANDRIVGAIGIAAPGDSGSGIISEDGRAVGLQVAVGAFWGTELGQTEGLSPGDVAIYRLGPQVAAAEKALGIDLELMTAPLEDA